MNRERAGQIANAHGITRTHAPEIFEKMVNAIMQATMERPEHEHQWYSMWTWPHGRYRCIDCGVLAAIAPTAKPE